jgi:hypothetical protein
VLPIVKSHNKHTEIVKSTCIRGVLGIRGVAVNMGGVATDKGGRICHNSGRIINDGLVVFI